MPPFLGPGIDRSIATLSAAILLLCHGALGSLHLISDPAAPTPSTGEHAAAHHPSDATGVAAPDERPTAHHADAEYFAVLLGTFLGGLALWLLLWNDARKVRVFSALRLAGRRPTTAPNLPRGPTPTFLQVLRL